MNRAMPRSRVTSRQISQRIANEAGRRIAHLGRIARIAAMTFAVDLDVVGLDLVDHELDHLRRGPLADAVAVIARVEIEMDAEEGVGPFHPRRIGGNRWLAEDAYYKRAECSQDERSEQSKGNVDWESVHSGNSCRLRLFIHSPIIAHRHPP